MKDRHNGGLVGAFRGAVTSRSGRMQASDSPNVYGCVPLNAFPDGHQAGTALTAQPVIPLYSGAKNTSHLRTESPLEAFTISETVPPPAVRPLPSQDAPTDSPSLWRRIAAWWQHTHEYEPVEEPEIEEGFGEPVAVRVEICVTCGKPRSVPLPKGDR